jgi:diacylglycerol kinase family enzyme
MYYIFVNPASKSGSGDALWSEAEKIFKERNIPYEVRYTKKNE